MMSQVQQTEAEKAAAEEARKKNEELQTQLSQQSSVNAGLTDEITSMRREKYTARINSAVQSGRCDKPTADKLTALAGTYQFSAANRDVKGELDFRLETIEALPAGAVWTEDEKIRQFSVSEERPGRSFFEGAEPSEEEANKLAEAMHPGCKASGPISIRE